MAHIILKRIRTMRLKSFSSAFSGTLLVSLLPPTSFIRDTKVFLCPLFFLNSGID